MTIEETLRAWCKKAGCEYVRYEEAGDDIVLHTDGMEMECSLHLFEQDLEAVERPLIMDLAETCSEVAADVEAKA